MIRHVTIKRFAELSGYTEAAIRGKIREGVWLESVVWIKAPDGRILIDIEGYEKWATGNQMSALHGRRRHVDTA
jgi:hypothetical protein